MKLGYNGNKLATDDLPAYRHSVPIHGRFPPTSRAGYRVSLTHPSPRIPKHPHPRTLVFPCLWMP